MLTSASINTETDHFIVSSRKSEELHGVSAGRTLGSPSEDTFSVFAAFQFSLLEFLGFVFTREAATAERAFRLDRR